MPASGVNSTAAATAATAQLLPASPTSATPFELNRETEEKLLALFRNSSEQLDRVQRRICTAKDHAQRIQKLRRRKAQLIEKNRLLAQSVNGPDEADQYEDADEEKKREKEAEEENQRTVHGVAAASSLASPRAAKGGKPVSQDWAHSSGLYQYCGPTGITGVVSAVFPGGQLFRITATDGTWAFYNDTRHYDMHVRYVLGVASCALAAGPAPSSVVRLPSGQWEASVLVPPEQTVTLFTGRAAGDVEQRCKAVLRPADVEGDTDTTLCAGALAAWAALEAAAPAVALPPISGAWEDTFAAEAVQASEAALEQCMQQRLPFVDPSFFPSHTRLYRRGVDAFAVVPLHWRTPRDFLPTRAAGEEALFTGPVSGASVAGGALLPDVNVLSVAALLADTPPAIASLFTHPEAATALLDQRSNRRRSTVAATVPEMERMLGAYRVQLCLSGWWRSLLVDTYLPAAQHRPEFAHCRDDLRALWLPLLEKAYAKAFGSYAAMLEATVPDVIANLTGTLCCSLASVWPSEGTDSNSTSINKEAEARRSAFVRLVKQHMQVPGRGGRLLLQAFPLSLAKSQGKRDRLEDIYVALGLTPGSTVAVLGLEELTSGHTLVRLRQNTRTPRSSDDCLAFWRQLAKPWVDALWELELTSDTASTKKEAEEKEEEERADGSGKGVLWMDLADVPQFFQEGFCHYPTTAWTGGEVRAKGCFAGCSGTPSIAAKLVVTAPSTVLIGLARAEQRLLLSRSRLRAYARRDKIEVNDTTTTTTVAMTSTAATRTSASVSLAVDGAEELRGVALQVVARDGEKHTLLLNSATPDVYAVGADLQYTFQRDAGVGLLLTPEQSPYYIVPRVSLLTDGAGNEADIPYVLSVTARTAKIGPASESSDTTTATAAEAPRLHVSFAEVSPSAPLLRHAKMAIGAVALSPRTDAKDVAAEYQLCHKVGDQRFFVHNKRIDVV